MMRVFQVVLRLLWALCAFALLSVTLWFFDESPKNDAELLLIYGMHVLSFPIGVAVGIGLAGVIELMHLASGKYLQSSYGMIVAYWLCFFAAGYWQWFKAVPWIHRKTKAWLRERRRRADGW